MARLCVEGKRGIRQNKALVQFSLRGKAGKVKRTWSSFLQWENRVEAKQKLIQLCWRGHGIGNKLHGSVSLKGQWGQANKKGHGQVLLKGARGQIRKRVAQFGGLC